MSKKWIELASMLISLTASEKLDWKETSEEDVFQTVLGGTVVQFARVGNFDGEDDYVVSILTRNGKKFDSFSDVNLKEISGSNWYTAFHEMHQSIQRRISGAEQILDNLIAELHKKDDGIPF